MLKRILRSRMFVRYFVSYLLIFMLSIFTVLYIVQYNLKTVVQNSFSEKDQGAVDTITESMSSQFLDINKTANSISSNITVILSKYNTDAYARYSAVSELKKYIVGNSLIKDVIYVDPRGEIMNTRYLAVLDGEMENGDINIGKVLAYINAHCYSCDFSLAALADEFDVSLAYMSNFFKKKKNVNLTDYVWELRQKRSEKLLRETDLTIDAISREVGYYNPASFRRKFKDSTGVSPSQFRKSGKQTDI